MGDNIWFQDYMMRILHDYMIIWLYDDKLYDYMIT